MKRRHKHNLSHYKLLTGMPGKLIPVGCVEVLPGDSFDHSAAVLLRCSPLLAPVMHRAMVRVHHFFVPNRIMWPAQASEYGAGWEQFITQGTTETSPDVPSITIANADKASALAKLYEYLGAPIGTLASGSIKLSALPIRAYRMIWNEWFRDQDLQTEVSLTDTTVTNGMLDVCWRKDTFTSARTSPQYGADVTLPLGTSAPVTYPSGLTLTDSSGNPIGGGDPTLDVYGTSGDLRSGSPPPALVQNVEIGGGVADLSAATAVSVITLREALGLQRYAERLQRGGHRIPEVLATLGVPSSDGRLQKPEYLGGGKTMISFSEVLQTSNGAAGPENTVGAMYGHGIAPARTARYRRFFEEWGYVISVLSVVPEAVYSSAVPRHFFKGFDGGLDSTRHIDDYWQPELEKIGDQAILKKELYPDGDSSDAEVFGYGPRYYEYRKQPSQVAGLFLPGRSLDYWTWARSFSSQPTLNSSFVTCSPSNRIFADQSGDDLLWCAVNHRLVARRLVTKNPTPRTF